MIAIVFLTNSLILFLGKSLGIEGGASCSWIIISINLPPEPEFDSTKLSSKPLTEFDSCEIASFSMDYYSN
jgi:hypothetical protein